MPFGHHPQRSAPGTRNGEGGPPTEEEEGARERRPVGEGTSCSSRRAGGWHALCVSLRNNVHRVEVYTFISTRSTWRRRYGREWCGARRRAGAERAGGYHSPLAKFGRVDGACERRAPRAAVGGAQVVREEGRGPGPGAEWRGGEDGRVDHWTRPPRAPSPSFPHPLDNKQPASIVSSRQCVHCGPMARFFFLTGLLLFFCPPPPPACCLSVCFVLMRLGRLSHSPPDSVAQLAERLAACYPEGPRFNPVPSLYFLFVFGSAAPYPPPFCYSLVCCVCA